MTDRDLESIGRCLTHLIALASSGAIDEAMHLLTLEWSPQNRARWVLLSTLRGAVDAFAEALDREEGRRGLE